MKQNLLLTTLVALALVACSAPPPTPPTAGKNTHVSASSPAQTLAGRWHNNTAGATKMFVPGKPGAIAGTVNGFWAVGGTYRVLREDPAKRSLHFTCASDDAGGDQQKQTFEATVSFTADGKHMTFENVKGEGGPEKGQIFYRTQ